MQLRPGHCHVDILLSPGGVDRVAALSALPGDACLANGGYFDYNGPGSGIRSDPACWRPVDLVVLRGKIIVPADRKRMRPILLAGAFPRLVTRQADIARIRHEASGLRRVWKQRARDAIALDDRCPADTRGSKRWRQFYVQVGSSLWFFQRYQTEAGCRRIAASWFGSAPMAFADGGATCDVRQRPRIPVCLALVPHSAPAVHLHKRDSLAEAPGNPLGSLLVLPPLIKVADPFSGLRP